MNRKAPEIIFMQLTKHIRLLTLSALISITALLNAQSTRSIVKGGTENGAFSGGVFIGWGAKITGSGTTSLLGTDSTSIVLWKDLLGVTQIGNTLTKTASTGWGNAGGASNNKLDTLENGWVDCKINSLSTEFAFGLSISNPDANFDSIRYAVLLDSGQINVYNLGVLIGNYGSAAINDSIRIERIGNILFYTKNGIVFLNQEIDAKQPLLVDIAIYTSGASVEIRTTGRTAVNAYFRTAQNGNWNQTTTWEISSDSISWAAATTTPDNNSKTIQIQSFDTVTITSSVAIDQTLVNGTLIYGNNAGSNITITNGVGTDLIVNGTFQDIGPNSIVWSDSSTWLLGNSISPMFPGGTLLRTRNTSADNWRNHYYNGISNIPATANWIIRKTGTDNPLLSSVPGMYYPNLTIENTSGSTWTASDSSGFIGSADYPRIKGVFNIGGSGTHPVVFVNQNTDSIPIWVGGNLTVKSGSTLHNLGTGFNVEDSMNVLGAYTGIKNLFLSGGNVQTISNTTFSIIKTLQVNKSGGYLRFDVPVSIDSLLKLTKGYIVTDSINILTITATASLIGGSDTSYVSGPVEKIGNTEFTFPLGDPTLTTGPYHPMTITAPDSLTDAFVGTYTPTAQTFGDSLQVDSLESISNCEYWTLKRISGTAAVIPSLGWNTNSCNVDDYSNLAVAGWNGTKWISFGEGGITVEAETGTLKGGWYLPLNPDFIPVVIAKPYPLTSCYATLKRELDGGSYIANGLLKFKFDEEYNDTDNKLSFKIYNNQHTVVVNSTSLPLAMQLASDNGEGWYSLNVLNCNISSTGNLGNGYYILEVQNEKKEKWYLRFKNTTNVICKK